MYIFDAFLHITPLFSGGIMKFKKLSLQKKLYISCILLNLILLTICCAVFYRYTTNSLKSNMQDTLISNTSLLCGELDSMIKFADNSLKELQTNEDMITIAKRIKEHSVNYFSRDISERYKFQQTFQSILISQGINGSISYISRYYDEVGVNYSTGLHSPLGKAVIKENEELFSLVNDYFYVTYVPPHEDYWREGKTVFSVVRSMRDTYNKYGVLILDFDISAITNLLNDFENADAHSITLLDQEGNFIYSTNSKLNVDSLINSYQRLSANGSGNLFSYDSGSLSCVKVSEITGWSFILTYDTASYIDSLRNMFFISALLFLSLFSITSIFLFLVTNMLTRPLQDLAMQLQNLEPGENIKVNDEVSTNEVATLTNSVQSFLSEIYEQNQRLTEARHRTMQAHYDAMEAQLNPHFLYNTLSVIGMTGLTTGNNTVFTMCNELASQLRYSLSYTRQAVSLQQEITNTKSYLYIMKQRFEDDLQYEWNLDGSLNDISVPKLILQPLVENCFQHGFQQTEHEILPPWKIWIKSSQKDDYWYLSITNNGAPFKPEKLEHLYQRIENFKRPDHLEQNMETVLQRQGFGLENTILRLNIYYHGKEYFHIFSKGQQTTVTIGGPLNPEKVFNRQ